MPKPSDGDRARFRSLVPEHGAVEVKPMFGNLGAFVNGHMFMGLFGSDVGVKLAEHDRAGLLAQPGTGPFGPSERPMSGYVSLPAAWTANEAGRWVDRAFSAAAALPPKKTRSRPGPKSRDRTGE